MMIVRRGLVQASSPLRFGSRAFSGNMQDAKYVEGTDASSESDDFQKPQDPIRREGAYKLGVTEELLINAPEAVKRALSIDNASQAEIVKYNKRVHIENFQRRSGDTGSSEVQIAVLTEDIKNLTRHLRENRGDVHNKRSMDRYLNRRKKLMTYLRSKNWDAYLSTITALGLRDTHPHSRANSRR